MWKLFLPVCLVIVISALFSVPTASAATITRFTLACLTEELYDESFNYLVKNDKDGIVQLVLSGNCAMLQAGETVSVIRRGFLIATIRYQGKKLFTSSEAIR